MNIINPLKGKTSYGWHFEQNIYSINSITRALKAGGGSSNIPKVITVGLLDIPGRFESARRVYSTEGISPTILTAQGGYSS